MTLRHIIQEFRTGEPRAPARFVAFRVVDLDGHVTLGIGVGKRFHQNVFQNAEDGRGCPDSERQREHCDHSKSRSFS